LDEFSAQAALSSGEIDWWELPSRDSADLVARDRNVTLISHYMPAMGILRFNQLYPPFDKPEARRALLKVIDQAETMTASPAPTRRIGWTALASSRTARHSPTTPGSRSCGGPAIRLRPRSSLSRPVTAASRPLS
jgi:ABC-type oligopeptide transport system substrate-binding subunit